MRKRSPFEAYTLDLTGSGSGVALIELVEVVYSTGYLPGDDRGQQASYVYVTIDGRTVATLDDRFEAREHVRTTYPTATHL
jgi:hypothetical protein